MADKWLTCKSVGLHKPVNFPSQKCMGINMPTDLGVFFIQQLRHEIQNMNQIWRNGLSDLDLSWPKILDNI